LKRFLLISTIIFAAFCLISFTQGTLEETECFAMDTVVTVKVGGKHADEALAAATDEIYRLHRLFSITDPNSDISALNNGSTDVSEETVSLITSALDISAKTDGAFDCTISPAVAAWGWYDDTHSVPTPETLQNAMDCVGWEYVHTNHNMVTFEKDGMALDLGGIAKGYAAERVSQVLTEKGVTSALIDLGGNLCLIGKKPDRTLWVIGIDDPNNKSDYLATITVSDCSVVTSGSYQRNFEQDGKLWHHILDPKTGYPADNGLQLVTVVCADNTVADGLSTALFVMGKEAAIDFWQSGTFDFDAVFVNSDGSVSVTEGLQDNFSCKTDYEVITH